ncbi:urease accessory protein UreD [Streptomyces sp. TRM66268-LWL]|uniref:Urease accessory protein UreD n=1 Tax=Streptomyces polyasparticus TaxID=2767826 RepID=A0ABR7SJB1_9ACTN|nr:urease accessory protein UreD [Streptomyces polyasparticus]MBC9714939.1 urease accessory protein UreD [Streptomyces polyasparticus]
MTAELLAVAPRAAVTIAGIEATARIEARPGPGGATVLPVLEGEGPLAVRRIRGLYGEGRVALVGAMSAPLGGDRLAVRADVADGARLHVAATAATIALPGQSGQPAHYDVRLTVGRGATLHWLPEQLISANGSDLRVTTRAEVAEDAVLVLREEQVLGRSGEAPGRLTSRLTVTCAGRPLLDQELSCGPGAPAGWDGPAVLAGLRALGQLLVVRPEFTESPVRPRMLGDRASLTPLAGPAALVTAVAADALAVRRILDEALELLLGEAADGR